MFFFVPKRRGTLPQNILLLLGALGFTTVEKCNYSCGQKVKKPYSLYGDKWFWVQMMLCAEMCFELQRPVATVLRSLDFLEYKLLL